MFACASPATQAGMLQSMAVERRAVALAAIGDAADVEVLLAACTPLQKAVVLAALPLRPRTAAVAAESPEALTSILDMSTAHEKAAIIAATALEARCAEMSKLEVWEQDAVVACASPEGKAAIVAAMEPAARALMVRKIVPSDIEVTFSLLYVTVYASPLLYVIQT